MYGNGRLIEKYQEQAVNTMSRGEQIVVLYDEVIKNLKYVSTLLDGGNQEAARKCLTKSRNILNYLTVILDGKYDLAERMKAIYSHMIGQIIMADATGDASHVNALVPQLEELREAWSEADKSLRAKGGMPQGRTP